MASDEKPRPMLQSSGLAKLLKPADDFKITGHEYLIGLRGLLTIESFVFLFLQTFVPVTIKDSLNTEGPIWQKILRDVFAVIFWNNGLIYSFYILISARAVCLPFLKDPTKMTMASSLFRRGIRLCITSAFGLAIVKIAFSQLGMQYITDFQELTGNISFPVPYQIPGTVAFFNSLGGLFWTTHNFTSQAANYAWPSQQIWVINAIYSQSLTVYMTMVIIPYTRGAWRIRAYLLFIVTAWWVQSWAWYTITGMLLADAVVNMDFRTRAAKGIRIPNTKDRRIPVWVPCALAMLGGLVMEYLWTAWKPSEANQELRIHTGLYYTGGLNVDANPATPQARDDNFLLVAGFMFLLESYPFLQRLLSNRLFLHLGHRSLSYFMITGTFIYTAGIKVAMHLMQTKGWSLDSAAGVCFILCLAIVPPAAELFHRLIDWPAQVVTRAFWNWLKA